MKIWDRAKLYYKTRGLPWQDWTEFPRGDKLKEETDELVEALENYHGLINQKHLLEVHHEIGDVAISLAWIAHASGTTIEECMTLKTEKDAGRGLGTKYMQGN